MTMVTLTELNQHPSQVARLAETEPVHIRRYGRSYLVLHREDDPLEDLRAAGLIRPPKTRVFEPVDHHVLNHDAAEAAYEDFLSSRSLDD